MKGTERVIANGTVREARRRRRSTDDASDGTRGQGVGRAGVLPCACCAYFLTYKGHHQNKSEEEEDCFYFTQTVQTTDIVTTTYTNCTVLYFVQTTNQTTNTGPRTVRQHTLLGKCTCKQNDYTHYLESTEKMPQSPRIGYL